MPKSGASRPTRGTRRRTKGGQGKSKRSDARKEPEIVEADPARQRAVEQINQVLARNGIEHSVASFQQLQELPFTQYYIEIYERIFDVCIDGIVREPFKVEHFVKNVQLVIDNLQLKLGVDEIDISGEKICLAHAEMICNLIQLLADFDEQRTVSEDETEEELEDARRLHGDGTNEDFIYKYLKSKLKPFVEGLNSPLLPKPAQDANLARKQKSFFKHAQKSHKSDATDGNTFAEANRDAARSRNELHKKRVEEIRRQRFMQDLEREQTARSVRKANHDEQVFKQLFVSAVKVEREALREEQRRRQGDLKRQQTEKKKRKEAIRKFYQDQAEILTDKLNSERSAQKRMEREHRREMETMEKEMEVKMMQSLRDQHHKSFQQQQADEIRRFDAEAISSKLLQTLAKGELEPRHSPRIGWGDLATVDEY